MMLQQLHSLLSLHSHLASDDTSFRDSPWPKDQQPKDWFLKTKCLFVYLYFFTLSCVCLSRAAQTDLNTDKSWFWSRACWGMGTGSSDSMGTGLSDKRLELYVASTHTAAQHHVSCVGVVLVVVRQSQIQLTVQENSAHRLQASSSEGGMMEGNKK